MSTVGAWASTATFTPVGPTTVAPGTPLTFQVTLAVSALASFDAADVVIGCAQATDLSFAYSAAWTAAFANVTPPTADVGFYTQDVFVGGNNPNPVGTNLSLGTVTVSTTGMAEGSYTVRIDPSVDRGVSRLTLDGVLEPLSGSATFTLLCVFNPDCDTDVDAADYAVMYSCATGPGGTVSNACRRFDVNSDGHVDLKDFSTFTRQFTGSH
ncbi:MAG: hypothetical protein HY763_05150 [Planctomycetes bacterium]|nr:hypothetical protein [Planctomycetota bacterium]